MTIDRSFFQNKKKGRTELRIDIDEQIFFPATSVSGLSPLHLVSTHSFVVVSITLYLSLFASSTNSPLPFPHRLHTHHPRPFHPSSSEMLLFPLSSSSSSSSSSYNNTNNYSIIITISDDKAYTKLYPILPILSLSLSLKYSMRDSRLEQKRARESITGEEDQNQILRGRDGTEEWRERGTEGDRR